MHSFSEDALDRPRRTLQAIETLRGKAEAIAHVSESAHEDEIIAVIVQADGTFGGVWTLAREEMVRQMHIVEDKGGWSFTFSPHTSTTQVGERCNELASLVSRRMQDKIKRENS